MKKKRGGVLFFIIAALTFLPILFAFILSQTDYRFDTWGKTYHGELMTPVIPVGPLLQGADESFLRAAQLGERWALLFVLPSECVTSCVEQIQLMQQMQIALGKYQDQLLKFVVVTASSFTTALKDIEIDSLAILTMRAPDGLVSDRLYLVDPFGNIVMAYHSSEDGMKILKDIRHLIKLSTTSR